MFSKLFISSILLLAFCGCHAITLPGVVMLDSYTFNKTLGHFKYSIVKFDVGFPTGDKHKIWGELGQDLQDVFKILVAEVRIKDYGDKQNMDLAERFGLTNKELLPEVILFFPDKSKGKHSNNVRFGAEFTLNNLKTFINSKTDLYLNLPGCLKDFDKLAERFMNSNTDQEKLEIIKKAEKEAEEEKDMNKHKADKYVKIMKLVLASGEQKIQDEQGRIQKLVTEQKMSLDKLEDLAKTLNILKTFETATPLKDVKDEL